MTAHLCAVEQALNGENGSQPNDAVNMCFIAAIVRSRSFVLRLAISSKVKELNTFMPALLATAKNVFLFC